MSESKDNLIDFSSERSKRIHDVHDKRLNDMREAFNQALPLPGAKAGKKTKSKKKR